MVQRSWLVIAAAAVACASAPPLDLGLSVAAGSSPPLAARSRAPPEFTSRRPSRPIRRSGRGVLADGLRYAILPITGEPVSLRLRIAAGPLTRGSGPPRIYRHPAPPGF